MRLMFAILLHVCYVGTFPQTESGNFERYQSDIPGAPFRVKITRFGQRVVFEIKKRNFFNFRSHS